ncbi:hypothetical protein IAD21_03650 [Abditibacteriota bacterium]|nr:hypothetical protein IAD21_03650 [Abditibacteriota bacterium]
MTRWSRCCALCAWTSACVTRSSSSRLAPGAPWAGDHVHFLLQSVPTYSPTKIITLIKSLVAREVFKRCPHVKQKLWGGEFWSDGYFVSTVGPQGNENTIANYVRDQGQDELNPREYQQLHRQS